MSRIFAFVTLIFVAAMIAWHLAAASEKETIFSAQVTLSKKEASRSLLLLTIVFWKSLAN